ncbi:MAG: MarR family winged helix-turn-helix transcriptional regulator [Candidatus Lernaella stagnicola]|nr:MarR family winged helix-turn-helix transcriptional regulator [Candidatus Lernaella stagnicola]
MTPANESLSERTRACLQLLVDEGFINWGRDRQNVVLPIQEAATVEVVGRLGPISMSELAVTSGMLPNTMTGIVDRLVQRGYLLRERAERDRRIVMVGLTKVGFEQLEKHKGFLLDFSKTLLERLAPKERDTLVPLLEKIAAPLTALLERKDGT